MPTIKVKVDGGIRSVSWEEPLEEISTDELVELQRDLNDILNNTKNMYSSIQPLIQSQRITGELAIRGVNKGE